MKSESAADAPAPVGRRVALIVGLVAAILCIATGSKGITDRLQDWGVVYWWLDYSDGMIRRGLVGQVFELVFGQLPLAKLTPVVMALNLLGVAALGGVLVGLCALVAGRLRGPERLGFAAFAVWIFVAQIWPTLVFNAGYLDTLVLVLAAGAALAMRRGWIIPAALCMAIGPLVHEYFVFLIPFIVASGLDDAAPPAERELIPLDAKPSGPPVWLPYAIGAVGVVSGLVVIALSRPDAAYAQLAPLALDEDLKQDLLRTTLTQGIGESMAGMLQRFGDEIPYAIANFAFFLLPTAAACLGLVLWRSPAFSLGPWARAATALLPVAALLVAWDLSRLLVLTNFPAALLFLLAAERRSRLPSDAAAPSSRLRRRLCWASIGLALVYACYPFTYTYFGQRPNFRYIAKNPYSYVITGTPLAVALERPWGQMDLPFEGEDVTCSLQPAGEGDDCRRTVRSGEMIHGPYLDLPLGDYRAEMRFRAPADCRNEIQAEVFDTPVANRQVAATRFRTGGEVVVNLDFRLSYDLARRARLETRILQGAGPACATLEKVYVRKLR